MRCKYCGSEIEDNCSICPVCVHKIIDDADSKIEWFYANGETALGPYSESDMKGLYDKGIINDSTYVWRQGLDNWLSLEQSEINYRLNDSVNGGGTVRYGATQSTVYTPFSADVSNDETANWYYNDASRDLGPFFQNELIDFYNKNIINDSTIVWNSKDNIKTSFQKSSIYSKINKQSAVKNVQPVEFKVTSQSKYDNVNRSKTSTKKTLTPALIALVAVLGVSFIVLMYKTMNNSSKSNSVEFTEVDEDIDGYTYIFNDGVAGETIFEDRIYKNISNESEISPFTPTRDGYVFSYWDRSTNFDSKTVILSAVWNQEASSSGYFLIPDSSTRYISTSDLKGFNYDDCQLAINEIYARHGRKFTTPSIQAYFNAQSWYTPTIEAKDFSDSMLTSIEFSNVKTIVNYEKSKGWR